MTPQVNAISVTASGKSSDMARLLRTLSSSTIPSGIFVLIKEYKGGINLYHLDLYRMDNVADIGALGLEEYFYSDGISVIEWAEKLKDLLPQEHLRIEIDIVYNK